MIPEDKKEKVRNIIKSDSDSYRLDFGDWVENNWHILVAFFNEANKVWDLGIRHHSARDLCAFLRHQSKIEEAEQRSRINPNGFKISNNASPYLARLYLTIKPERDGLFELKELKASQ